jgi:RNA polymerase sigma factor (sigma-70 family)
MVLAVCQRITGHTQDAEDAFQATFLVLARRAADVRPAEQVGNWLYGVAVRTARAARVAAARRRAQEAPTHPLPEVGRADPYSFPEDVRAVLDEELVRLPDKYRALLVHCDLGGEPQTATARRLGLPVGTIYSRLAKARELLADRLKGRGVALSAAFMTGGMVTLSPRLFAGTTRLVATRGQIPPAIATLSEGAMRSMLAHKLMRVITAVVVAVTFGGWLLAGGEPPAPPSDPKATPTPENPKPVLPAAQSARPKPLPKGPNQILAFRAMHLTLIDPDGTSNPKVREDLDRTGNTLNQRLSPDGTKVAAVAIDGGPKGRPRKLYVWNLLSPEPPTPMELECIHFAWSPDGSELVCSTDLTDANKKKTIVHTIVNIKTREKTPLPLPSDHHVLDWSKDGRYFLTFQYDFSKKRTFPTRLMLMNRDGTECKSLTSLEKMVVFARFSPDGKQVLYTAFTPGKDSKGEVKDEIAVLDIASKISTPIADVPLNGEQFRACWSPDGKKIAYSWHTKLEGKPVAEEVESVLVVCDPDGKNQKTIATEKGHWAGITLVLLDWR